MRIPCPYCGDRDYSEFTYLGDASKSRPALCTADEAAAFVEFVYLRANPAGPIAELWYHAAGCRQWLEIVRDTRDHHISTSRLTRGDAA